MRSIAIYGGTFDPIHNGHLQTSITIQDYFKFDSYLFLPCKVPALKFSAIANTKQRIKMIELAIKDYPHFNIDLREIERDTPSYMVETLGSFREEYPNAAITLIIGYDSFISLPHWHQWEQLISLANILVINRNEFSNQKIPEVMQQFLKKHQSIDKNAVLQHKAGIVYLFDAGHYEISSRVIREELKQKTNLSSMLPKEVYQYIKDEGLY